MKFSPYFKTVLWGGEKIASYKGMATDLHNIGESWELSCLDGKETVAVGGIFEGLTLKQVIGVLKERLVGRHIYEKFGCDFPLLVKIIDAKENLSLQVHPDDRVAQMFHNGSGKTEMWYVIKADDDAKIYSGLKEEITPEEYERRVADNTIMDVVACHYSHDGDLFFCHSHDGYFSRVFERMTQPRYHSKQSNGSRHSEVCYHFAVITEKV